MASNSSTSYDEVPYRSYPFPQAHPERMATIARLFGMSPMDIENCRVLEIGCASGGNLLPMAARLPGSQFLGIDLSNRQVEDGQREIQAVGLENIELRHQDLLDFDCNGESFDYVICHGVYSWIPDSAQKRILEICQACLSSDGVAYVSYNTYPGWHMRGMIRELMEYRSRNLVGPEDRVRQARSLLHFLAESVSKDKNPYGMLLEQEAKQLQNKDDYYLLHEHLEEFNEPVYFHQFAQRASEFGLQYLGEADYGSMSLQNFPADVAKMLSSLAGDLIEMEQYMDFTRNRMFRQTLLCHQARKLERSISLQNVAEMSIATQARMEGKKNSELSNGPVVFKTEKAATRTSDPIVRAALQCISDAWPKFVSFQEAYSVARSAVEDGPVIVGHSHETPEAMNLAKNILRCFETGLLELSVCPPKVECSPSEKPITNSLIRHRARVGSEVTNLRHQSIRINDLEQQVLQRLNGVSTLDQIQEEVHHWVISNGLTVRRNGAVVTDESEVQAAAFNAVAEAMQKICQFCLVAEKEDH